MKNFEIIIGQLFFFLLLIWNKKLYSSLNEKNKIKNKKMKCLPLNYNEDFEEETCLETES